MIRLSLLAALIAAPASAQDAKAGRQYALLVACKSYVGSEFPELPHAIKEMAEFEQVLIGSGFAADDVAFLHDEQKETKQRPLLRNINRELGLMLAKAKKGDTVLVVLNGHGLHFKGDKVSLFQPVDAEFDDKATMLPIEGDKGVLGKLEACAAGRKLLLVNACRNDPIDVGMAARQVQLDDADTDTQATGVATLYSCKPGQRSFYYPPKDKVAKSPGHERSLFFHHLITAWKGEYAGGKAITLDHVIGEVESRTADEAGVLLGKSQVPLTKRKYEGTWLIAGQIYYDLTAGYRFVQFALDGTVQVLSVINSREATRFEAWVIDPMGVRAAVGPLKHNEWVDHAAFSPDGKCVVTASSDKTARIWDATTGKPLAGPLRHDKGIAHASFSPNGRRVVTASYDKTACVWDVETGKLLAGPLRHNGSVVHAAFSPDGRRVVTASWDGTARVWDAATGKPEEKSLKHGLMLKHATFSPDGRRVVTASIDKTARVWDAATGKLVAGSLEHESGVNHVALSLDGRRVVTVSLKLAHIWDAETGELVAGPLKHDLGVHAAYSPDGRRVVTASMDGTARVWDAETGKPITPPLWHATALGPVTRGEYVGHAAFSPDGRRVVTVSGVGTAHVWNAQTGKLLGTTSPSEPKK